MEAYASYRMSQMAVQHWFNQAGSGGQEDQTVRLQPHSLPDPAEAPDGLGRVPSRRGTRGSRAGSRSTSSGRRARPRSRASR
eukprot:9955504-Lingulodinium_polyedra.AAC.1